MRVEPGQGTRAGSDEIVSDDPAAAAASVGPAQQQGEKKEEVIATTFLVRIKRTNLDRLPWSSLIT